MYPSRIGHEANYFGIALYELNSRKKTLRKINEWRQNYVRFNGMDVSRDGSNIIFSMGHQQLSPARLFQFRSGRTNRVKINSSHGQTQPSLSVNNRIAYNEFRPQTGDHGRIFIDNELFVDCGKIGGICNDAAAWSPDGKYIVIAVNESNEGRLYRFNVEDRSSTLLSHEPILNPGKFGNPMYSPQGDKIAFLRLPSTQEPSELWIMDNNGDNPVRLLSSSVSNPVWSPDGTKLLIQQWKPYGTYAINSDGTELTLITKSWPFWLDYRWINGEPDQL